MTVPTSCSRNRNDVTTPKLPPPPRIAQYRSGFSSALARTRSPLASTSSASSRLSIARPYLRVRWPRPPPSVRPPTPVVEMIPLGVARPCSFVARSTSPQVQPPPTRTVRAPGSTSMSFSSERSITTPSSHVPSPAPLWPPPRTASSRSWSRAKRDDLGDVVGVRAARDQRRPLVDHRVVDLARLVVVGVVGADQPSLEPGELAARSLRGCRESAHSSSLLVVAPSRR